MSCSGAGAEFVYGTKWGENRVTLSRLRCYVGIRQVLPGSQSRRCPEAHRRGQRLQSEACNAKYSPESAICGLSQIGQPLQVVCFGWSRFPIPEACLAGVGGPIYGFYASRSSLWPSRFAPLSQCQYRPRLCRRPVHARESQPDALPTDKVSISLLSGIVLWLDSYPEAHVPSKHHAYE